MTVAAHANFIPTRHVGIKSDSGVVHFSIVSSRSKTGDGRENGAQVRENEK